MWSMLMNFVVEKWSTYYLVVLGLVLISWSFGDKLDLKVDQAIKKTYSLDTYSKESVDVPSEIDKTLPKGTRKCLYKIVSNDSLYGYIYIGQSPSMKNVFDYAIFFDNNLSIVKTKVLIYRELHGRQIGTVRWLKQFIGLVPNDRPMLGIEIDGISGATISARSMTDSVREVLETMQVLKQNSLI